MLGFVACGALIAPALSYAQVQDPTVVKLVNPIGGTKENPEGTVAVPVILGGILTKALGVMGSAALLMFVIGGAMWLTSAGNSERVQKGTETMVWAAIGVLIIFSSYAILRLVLGGIGAEGIDAPNAATDSAATAQSKGACLCAKLDQAANKVISSQVVTATSAGDCEADPGGKGKFDICSWTDLNPGAGCLCKNIDIETKAVIDGAIVDAVDSPAGCKAYTKTNDLYNACGWYNIK